MKIARLITAILVSIFLFNTTYVLSDNNNDFSKNRVEQARSIFKQIEKGNWSLALKKSKKINNKMLSDLIYWLYLNKKRIMQIFMIIKILLLKILIFQINLICNIYRNTK